jgi:hypothetical protein
MVDACLTATWTSVCAVVVDAATGESVRRVPVDVPRLLAWDGQGNLIMTTADLGAEPGVISEFPLGNSQPFVGGLTDIRYWRIDMGSGQRAEVGRDLPRGGLYSSPDGTQMVLLHYAHPAEVYAVDPGLAHARQLVSIGDGPRLQPFAWAPDGTAFAFIVSGQDGWELQVREGATGSMIRRTHVAVTGDLLWLPAD